MIFIKDLELQFGKQIVFENINCTIDKLDHIGLVGRNGTGKSTLLKIISKEMSADSGEIEMQRGIKLAYMPQEVVMTSYKNVLEETLSSLGQLYEHYEEAQELEKIIHNHPTLQQMNRFAELDHELREQNFDIQKAQAQKILAGLGFDQVKQAQFVDQLSVGWRMRIVLAKLLLQNADFYLFDEPTNHLDLPAKNWFMDFLKYGNFGYLLVCHDRQFLDNVCDKIFEVSLAKLNIYYGNYSFYIEQKHIREEHLLHAYAQQQREIKHKQSIIDRFRASATKAAMAQSMIKSLDKIDRIELEHKPKTLKIKTHAPVRSGEIVLTVKNVAYGFNNKPLFKNTSFEIRRGDKVALVAPNGTGKTTLFNLIAGKLKLQHGSIELGYNVTPALFDQDQERILDPRKTVLQEVTDATPGATEAQIRAMLGAFLFSGDDVKKLTSVLSGGERNRVAMSKIILSKANLFLLDEPTNHLDIESKEIILEALKHFEGTVLFVSHDQYFTNKLATKIIELTAQESTLFFGDYDNYIATKNTLQSGSSKQGATTNKTTPIVNQENKKDLYLLQKKAKNMKNKLNNLEQKIATLSTNLGHTLYGTDAYDTNTAQLQQAEQDFANTNKELEALQKQIEGLS